MSTRIAIDPRSLMKQPTPKTIHSVHVNLLFRGGLDTERYARELRALHDAAMALSRVAAESSTPEVGGQSCDPDDRICQIILGSGLLSSDTASHWTSLWDADGQIVLTY